MSPPSDLQADPDARDDGAVSGQPHGDEHGSLPDGAALALRACQNCGAALPGPYCGFCGQRAIRIDVSLRELIHEGVHELVHLDSRIFVTLRLLFARPGQLTTDVLAGRRQRYISPVRLYLLCSVLFFLALAQLVPAPKPESEADLSTDRDVRAWHFADKTFDRRLRTGLERVAGEPEAFMHTLWSRAPKAAFVLVPAFGLLTMAAFRRRVRFFVPHLYFALHVHSFGFLALIALLALGKWLSQPVALAGLVLLPPLYLVAATRNTFEATWAEAIAKSLLVSLVYAALLGLALLGVLVVSVLSF
jgi:hypothetical protein